MLFLYPKVTFDTVWHKALIYNIHAMDLPTEAIKLISSFLSKRCFRLKVKKSFPPYTLFFLYIKNILHWDTTKLALFANDMAVITTANRPDDASNRTQRHPKIL